MRAAVAIGAIGIGVVLALGPSACGGAAPAERAHLLLVSADALRADHLSLNGYARETSPCIDAFAREALDYGDMVTLLPKTGPSMATHLTGLAPCEHGVTANKLCIPDEAPTVAEALLAAGYRTAAFVSNPVLSADKGFARGFEVYREIGEEGALPELNRRFLKWAEKHDWSEPTFVWLHYIDPHGPYTPPSECAELFTGDELFAAETRRLPTTYDPLPGWPINYCHGAIPNYQLIEGEDRVASYVARYDAEIRHMDAHFGAVLDYLRRAGLYERTAVILTADHGEAMGERDYWFEHGWYADEAALRIPMIVKPAGAHSTSPARPMRITAQVSNLDTAPTLLAAAGLPPFPGARGASLLADPGARGALLIENTSTYPERFFGLRLAGKKYLREEASGAEELYDLAADPREERDRAAVEPELAARLARELDAALDACRAVGSTREVEPDGEAQRALGKLGYTE
jgi:arylsulfatase